jgi:hypothetical protein
LEGKKMRKTFGLIAMMIVASGVMAVPGLARDRNDSVNRYDNRSQYVSSNNTRAVREYRERLERERRLRQLWKRYASRFDDHGHNAWR